MNRQELGYKSVVLGRQSLSFEVQANLPIQTIYGVKVHTDSEELIRCLKLAGGESIDKASKINLYYFTLSPLPFRRMPNACLQSQKPDYPGDIYMSPESNNFYFSGADKFGTLISIVYGIRSLQLVDNETIGIHSSLIYDNDKKSAFLLVGKNLSGKSTLGNLIEQSDSGRYQMVSDDWNEVNVATLLAEPISTLFSPSQITPNYEMAFNSFGKNFFWKHGVYPHPRLVLTKIFEIHDSDEESSGDQFIAKAMAHIPTLSQPICMNDFDYPNMYSTRDLQMLLAFKNEYFRKYRKLITSCQLIQLVNRKNIDNIQLVVDTIIKNIN